jgi:hypothetical protein
LDVDRTLVVPSEQKPAPRAFSDETDVGRGTDAEFTHFNTLCLALGLDLLELGFKQSEIVSFFRHTRMHFDEAFAAIAKSKPVIDQLVFPVKGSKLPTRDVGGKPYADYRQYVVINRIELTETFERHHSERRVKDRAMLFVPRFYCGIKELAKAIDEQPNELRRFIVIELTALFVRLKWTLDAAEPVARGRRPG